MQKSDETYTDERLASLSCSSDEVSVEASAALLSRFEPIVKSIASNYFVPGAEAEDVLQEGRIGLFKAMMSYDSERSDKFRPFAIMCIKQQIQSAVRSAARKKHMPLNSYISLDIHSGDNEGDNALTAAAGEGDPEAILIGRESIELIENIINTSLSDTERGVLDMYIKGHSYKDIAADMGRNTKFVDNTIQAIKRKLRARIK